MNDLGSNLIPCKVCGKEVSKHAQTCPHCGAKLKKSLGMKILIGGLAFIVLIIIFASLGGNDNNSSTNEGTENSQGQTTGSEAPKEDLTLEEGWEITSTEYGGNAIVGYVVNNTDNKYSYVEITFILKDEDGNQVGQAIANVNSLQPNGKWKFSAVCLEENFKTAEFDDITSVEDF